MNNPIPKRGFEVYTTNPTVELCAKALERDGIVVLDIYPTEANEFCKSFIEHLNSIRVLFQQRCHFSDNYGYVYIFFDPNKFAPEKVIDLVVRNYNPLSE